MTLEEKIDQDIKDAMRSKDAMRLSVLRLIKTAVTNAKIQKKREVLEESEIVEVIQKQAKQRKESAESFTNAGRSDLADKEKQELAIIEAYLPKQLNDDEIRTLAEKAIAASGASSKGDVGRVMKELMPLVKGKADGKRVSSILNGLLH